MNILSAEFLTSVANREDILRTDLPEIAFVGRSNVGKSSLINSLTGVKKLAKTSSMPGLTKLVNYFKINGKFLFVDLPGYGYAKTSKIQQGEWSSLIGDYLLTSEDLRIVLLLLDIRLLPNKLDKLMVDFLLDNKIPFAVITTKADKLSLAARKKSIDAIAKELNMRKEAIFAVSSTKGDGRNELLDFIEAVVNS